MPTRSLRTGKTKKKISKSNYFDRVMITSLVSIKLVRFLLEHLKPSRII